MGTDERHESLWWLALSPALWAAHLLLAYGTAAIWCAKVAGRGGDLGGARAAIWGYTGAALVGIGLVGARGLRRHRLRGGVLPHDYDTPGDRSRFLGLATLLLSALSAVAVGYAGLALGLSGSCR